MLRFQHFSHFLLQVSVSGFLKEERPVAGAPLTRYPLVLLKSWPSEDVDPKDHSYQISQGLS